MKKVFAILLLSLPLMASAASNCDEISASIAEKITNNGVPAANFQLKLIPADQAQQQIEGKIVGSCDRGQQNIVYVRLDGVTTPVAAPEAKNTVTEQVQPVEKAVEKVETKVEEKVESAQPTPVAVPEENKTLETTQPQEDQAAPVTPAAK